MVHRVATDRDRLRADVEGRLGRRQLVWAGIRGTDVEPLRDVAQLSASYSLVGAYAGRADVLGFAYEDLTDTRVDPEVWDIDDHHEDEATGEFRRALLGGLSSETALVAYRPSSFLSAIHFARRDRCLNLGLFGAHQAAFEHKPFVESAVADLSLPHIPWTYFADEEQVNVRELAASGPLMLRRSRTSGGEGFVRVDSAEDVKAHWPHGEEAFVSVAKYLQGGIPVNVGATVWRDADSEDCVTVHHASVQLIGIPSCVTRPFGYCGNDFGLARELDRATVDQIEVSTREIGRWLRGYGYVGTFGVDYLVHEGVALFTEINARFQGSTASSCRLSIEEGVPCLMLEHLAAWLGSAKPATVPLWERVRQQPDLSNLVVHWTGNRTRVLDTRSLGVTLTQSPCLATDVELLPPRDVRNEPGSLVGRLSFRGRLTETGYDLCEDVDTGVSTWNVALSA